MWRKRVVPNMALGVMVCAILAGCGEDSESGHVPFYGPSFTVVPQTVEVSERGGVVSLSVLFSEEPTQGVTVRATHQDDTELRVLNPVQTWSSASSGVLTFDIEGVDDGIRDGNQIIILTFALESSDARWSGVAPQTVVVTVVDDGSAGATCEVSCRDASTLVTCPEGGSGAPVEVMCEYGCADNACQGATQTCEVSCRDASTLVTCPEGESGAPVEVTCEYGCADNACQKAEDGEGTVIRFMAANVTSGNYSDYDDGRGIRLMQAAQADIVFIQEFSYTDGLRALVDTTFGPEFYYYKGYGSKPNGVISRYPIVEHGSWQSSAYSDRQWEWAIIDIPGPRDLLAISLHLHSSKNATEMPKLVKNIQSKLGEGDYYLAIGGDFNTKSRGGVRSNFGKITVVGKDGPETCTGGEFPVDQENNSCTSAERDDPYDWVLFDSTLHSYEIPITIGSHTYTHGHVLDSRVYDRLGELDDVPPVQAEDSDKCYDNPYCDTSGNRTQTNMQHMVVIRDIRLPVES